ncbi:MAG: Holliday junction resolvase Hjc [archaeon]|nr:Holliday junction resolvase Hjc [archaeon]
MSNKAKGSKAERELLSLFTQQGWRAVRVAGSGVNDNSPCDLLAAKIGRKGYTIEAKSSKKSSIYISKQQIDDFVRFSLTLGLNPVIALRFNYEGWLFLNPSQLEDSGKNWVVSLKNAKEKGSRFSQFFEPEIKTDINE